MFWVESKTTAMQHPKQHPQSVQRQTVDSNIAETFVSCWQDPGPQRQLTVSLGIILPAELEAPGSKGSGHAAAFHHSLLLSVRFYLSRSSYHALSVPSFNRI